MFWQFTVFQRVGGIYRSNVLQLIIKFTDEILI